MKTCVPIQPFEDSMRDGIVRAICQAFKDEPDFNPDTCSFAADHVIAFLASRLLGFSVTLAPQTIIGNGTLILDTDQFPAGS